jgi:hypothetical protein
VPAQRLAAVSLLLALAGARAVGAPEPPVEVVRLGTGTRYRFKGLALDPEARVAYLASWDRRRLVAADLRRGTHRVIPTPYDGRLNALGVCLRGELLYAVMNEVDDAPAARALSVLLVIDTRDFRVLRVFERRAAGGRHHFNHVAVDAQGVAYVSDTLQAAIWTVDATRSDARLSLLVSHPDLTRVHGLDLSADTRRLFATSYGAGIKFFDLTTGRLLPFADRATAGDDGLKYHRGALYAAGRNAIRRFVLNGAQDAVVRTEVLLQDHGLFDDPRDLHVEDGRIHCLANIELARPRTGRPPLLDSHLLVLPI